VLSVDEDQIVIISSKTKQVAKTPVKDILGVKDKRFSVGKTFGIPVAALITAILIYAAFGEQPSSSVDDQ
jgi:acid phosphatase family membrane protein YuiD